MKKERIETLLELCKEGLNHELNPVIEFNFQIIKECLDAIEDLKEQLLNMKLEAQHWKIVAAQLQKTKGKEG